MPALSATTAPTYKVGNRKTAGFVAQNSLAAFNRQHRSRGEPYSRPPAHTNPYRFADEHGVTAKTPTEMNDAASNQRRHALSDGIASRMRPVITPV